MANETRLRAQVLPQLTSVSEAQHNHLRAAGAHGAEYWSTQPDEDRPVYKKFKTEVKNYYRSEQGRRCCYCSVEIQNDHGTFDAEHILDKSTHPQFMFELNNLAASCRPCNRSKGTQVTLAESVQCQTVPVQATDYVIVHPHLDEWDQHLEFDELKRIRPKDGSPKGSKTIVMCGISTLNAARLSDFFSLGRGRAEEALHKFFDYKQLSRKQAMLELLRALAGQGDATARAIVDRLEEEMRLELEAPAPPQRRKRRLQIQGTNQDR